MGRKQSDIVDYFPHFAEAGKTLFILKTRYGNDGYAFWFQLLEILCTEVGHFYDCSEEHTWQYLLSRTGTKNAITGTEILDLLANLGKIDKELWGKKIIWCENLVLNLDPVYKKRGRPSPSKPSLNGHLLVSAPDTDITAPDTDITGTEMLQSRVEYSRVNKSREEATTIWGKSLELLSSQVSKPNYRTWFSKTTALGYREDCLIIGVPNQNVINYLNKNQISLIQKTLIEISNKTVDFEFVIIEAVAAE